MTCISAFRTPAALAAALLQDTSVHSPAYIDESGRRHRERRYDLGDVGGRISEDKRRLIEFTALRDQCEAGRMLAEALRVEALSLATDIFAKHEERAA